jgi:hypothetical protein
MLQTALWGLALEDRTLEVDGQFHLLSIRPDEGLQLCALDGPWGSHLACVFRSHVAWGFNRLLFVLSLHA